MKVKVEFTCEIYDTNHTPWFAVNNILQCTSLDHVEDLVVSDPETGEEL